MKTAIKKVTLHNGDERFYVKVKKGFFSRWQYASSNFDSDSMYPHIKHSLYESTARFTSLIDARMCQSGFHAKQIKKVDYL